jgi:hypothetical protein
LQAAFLQAFDNIDRVFQRRRNTLDLDWDTYKQLCDSPEVFSRWMLEQTSELLDGELSERLAGSLAGKPLDKPEDHTGGMSTDMFLLTLHATEADAIAERVAGAAAAGVTTSGTRGRGLGGFREAWREYSQYLSQARVL